LKAKRTRAPAYSRALKRIKVGFPEGVQEKLRSNFQNKAYQEPWDRIAVKVGVVQMGRVNDQMGQGRSVWREDILTLSGRPGGDG